MLVNIVVPTMNGRDNAATFMGSLAGEARVDVTTVVERHDGDAAVAWAKAGATVRFASGPSFAHKVNVGFWAGTAPWILMVGDDVRFHDGWLDAFLDIADGGAEVIGTNDLGSAVSDAFSPHLFIARDYILAEGASWDGPGIVCHEGYRHGYVDNEIIAVAFQRGTWAMSWGSVIEHLHPFYGKGADDPIYRLGQSFVDADAAVWQARKRQFAGVAA